MTVSDGRFACGCRSYRPGHNCHAIQARLANSDPSSWFPAEVAVVDQEEATVKYRDGSIARLWRHRGFDGRASLGTQLLVCERWSLISVLGSEARDQLSVDVRDPS